jgi:2-keto-4-pentenoate hydratase/2-oxohepta-3-ene-1,7-dioic acid hydratase in catechol pathway
MKLATFATDQGPCIGIVSGDIVFPLSDDFPRDMIDLIAQWPDIKTRLQAHAVTATGVPLASLRLLAPIARPGKIMAIGLNYADHIAESKLPVPTAQLWFCKQSNTIHPPYAPIEIPLVSDQVDYEVELVVVIGRKGRHISVAQAPDHVFGYCVGNDVSVRDWQKATPQWVLGKSFDTHGPIGPWITTADEIGDPHRLGIRAIVNGETRQNSNTRELLFNVWDQIAHLSQAMTLEPGDIFFSGTPGGVGLGMNPPVFLKAGDRVRCEIEELGAIDALFAMEKSE